MVDKIVALQLLDTSGNIKNINLCNKDVTIINFWASWCAPCKAEIPELIKYYSEHKDIVNFYGINLANTEKIDIHNFIREEGINFPVLFDTRGIVGKHFDIKSIPTTIVITKQDNIFYIESFRGAVTRDMLEKYSN